MDPTHVNENGDQKKTNPIAVNAESDMQTLGTNPGAEKETSCSSSTSSDDTNEEDFFQLEGAILGNPFLSTFAPGITLGASQDGGNGQLTVLGSKQQSGSLLAGNQKMTANSSVSPRTSSATSPESGQLGMFDPKQSPPVQTMSRTSDESPDPSRIPSSVFARTKSTTPMEWSVASNESLFSINVGNSSFSKDHAFLYGKSGELGSPSDPMAPLPPLPSSSPSSSPMTAKAAKAAAQASARVKNAEVAKGTFPKGKADGHTDSDRDGDESTVYSHSMSHRSDGSTTSFAFPMCCVFPKLTCNFFRLTGEGRSGSLKEEPDLPRQSTPQPKPAEPQAATDTPKAAEPPKAEEAPPAQAKWFPWCTCCPFCC